MDYKDMTVEQLDREKERLKSRYNEIEDQCVHDGLSWDEFCKKAKKEREGLYFIDKYKRLKKDPIVEYGKEWKGDTYTMEEFKKMVNDGIFTDDDGYGYYATETSKSDVFIYPSDITENLIRVDFSHVIWFNK